MKDLRYDASINAQFPHKPCDALRNSTKACWQKLYLPIMPYLLKWLPVERDIQVVVSAMHDFSPGILKSGPLLQSLANQTHLSMLIRVFRIIRKSQVGEFDQGWS